MADPNTKGDQAMPDTKYLQKRDGCWYIRVARPPKSWGLGGKEFLHSLKTGELRHAQRLRDKHLCPILAEDSSVRMVEAIARPPAPRRWRRDVGRLRDRVRPTAVPL